MDEEYINIVTFNTFSEARDAAEVLNENGIGFRFNEVIMGPGQAFPSAIGDDSIDIAVKKEDVDRACQLLSIKDAYDDNNEISSIAGFSTEELIDVASSSGEWGSVLVDEARQILRARGYYNFDRLNEIKRKKVERLHMGKQASRLWVSIGFISALLAGPIGIIMGYSFLTIREKDLNGDYYYIYDSDTRKAGLLMMIIGIIQLGTVIFISIMKHIRP